MYTAGKLDGLDGITACVVDADCKYIALCPFKENAIMIADILNQIENGTLVFVEQAETS